MEPLPPPNPPSFLMFPIASKKKRLMVKKMIIYSSGKKVYQAASRATPSLSLTAALRRCEFFHRASLQWYSHMIHVTPSSISLTDGLTVLLCFCDKGISACPERDRDPSWGVGCRLGCQRSCQRDTESDGEAESTAGSWTGWKK